MVYKLLEKKLASEISNRGFKEGLLKVHETPNKYKLAGERVYVWICADTKRFAGERVHSSLQGPWQKRLKPLQSSKVTFLYSKNNLNYSLETALFSSSNDKSRAYEHTSYLRVPGIMKDGVSTTPFRLGGKMVVFFIAIPSPFPEIKSQGGKKTSNNWSFGHLKLQTMTI